MSVTASEARQRLFPLIEEVNDDQVAVEIVSKEGTAFLVSADEYRSLKETVYLLQSPRNAERLRASIAQVRRVSRAPGQESRSGSAATCRVSGHGVSTRSTGSSTPSRGRTSSSCRSGTTTEASRG